MGVVRATRFSHTKWATWAGSWVTFCGLGRLRVKKVTWFWLRHGRARDSEVSA
jgi:hypothetical protein